MDMLYLKAVHLFQTIKKQTIKKWVPHLSSIASKNDGWKMKFFLLGFGNFPGASCWNHRKGPRLQNLLAERVIY